MNDPIRLWSYQREYADLRDEIAAACERVFLSGTLVLGGEGRAFEAELASSLGVAGAVGVGNGTDAIVIALAALGVQRGDDVITVANTAIPTVSAITTLGARPVLVDAGEDCLIDPARIEAAITPSTRAIIPVHLYGQAADMDAINDIARRRGLFVLEDNAQAHGATYRGRAVGALGDAATFSFYPTKNLGAYGDGGAIVANDPVVLGRARSLRFYGTEGPYYAERDGYNSRLDEIQAAILRVKFPHLPAWVKRRREIAARYDQALGGTRFVPVGARDYGRHAYHLYVVESDQRDADMARLRAAEIGTGITYPWPIHLMRGYAWLGYVPGDFPVAERKAGRIMNLPMYPQLDDAAVDRVIEMLLADG
ncbi:MAG: DegT/DnrJ/EryC1/StrS family aminotransferase [Pseudomonadota bacterium]